MTTAEPIRIFISYAHEDEAYLKGICTILKPLELDQRISVWTDKHILASRDWNREIVKNLSDAHIVLMLISQDFLASEYITHTEIKNVLDRHIDNEHIHVVQVLVRPVLLNLLPFGNLQSIPTGTKPVSQWPTSDDAWNDVLTHIQQLLDSIGAKGNRDIKERPAGKKSAGLTDRIVRVLFVLLIAISIGVFFFGMLGGGHDDDRIFYSLTSLAGMGSGFGGYTMVRRWS